MSINTTAYRLREQMEKFLGIFSPHFSKPKRRFLGQMIYGIQASQDVKISSIARSLGEDILLKKTEERLGRHLGERALGQKVNEILIKAAAGRIRKDTLIDPTDICKPYAEKMPHLAKVRDGSRGEIVNGYWCCVAVACLR